MKKIFLSFVFLFILLSLYHFSISLHYFMQIKQLNESKNIFLTYSPESTGKKYIYKGDVIYSAIRGIYQYHKAGIYIYWKQPKEQLPLSNLTGSAIRKSDDDTQTIVFTFSDLKKITHMIPNFPGYTCYQLDHKFINFYTGYNSLEFNIKGVELKNPPENLFVMISFYNHKGTTLPFVFLLRGLAYGSVALVIVIFQLLIKKIKLAIHGKKENADSHDK